MARELGLSFPKTCDCTPQLIYVIKLIHEYLNLFDYQKHLRVKNILEIRNQEGGKHFLHHRVKSHWNWSKQLKHAMTVHKVLICVRILKQHEAMFDTFH